MDLSQISAAATYGTAPKPAAAEAPEMARAADAFMATLRAAEAEGARAVTGGGDPHALVTAVSEARLAVEATVAVRDKMVEAYQELLRMPV